MSSEGQAYCRPNIGTIRISMCIPSCASSFNFLPIDIAFFYHIYARSFVELKSKIQITSLMLPKDVAIFQKMLGEF